MDKNAREKFTAAMNAGDEIYAVGMESLGHQISLHSKDWRYAYSAQDRRPRTIESQAAFNAAGDVLEMNTRFFVYTDKGERAVLTTQDTARQLLQETLATCPNTNFYTITDTSPLLDSKQGLQYLVNVAAVENVEADVDEGGVMIELTDSNYRLGDTGISGDSVLLVPCHHRLGYNDVWQEAENALALDPQAPNRERLVFDKARVLLLKDKKEEYIQKCATDIEAGINAVKNGPAASPAPAPIP